MVVISVSALTGTGGFSMAMPDVDWMRFASCRSEDARLFFAPEEKELKELRLHRELAAKAVCRRCPVQDDCLEYAVRKPERMGIWGGLNEFERATKR